MSLSEEKSRRSTLIELIDFTRDIQSLDDDLAKFEWDSEEDLVVLNPSHIKNVLSRFIDEEISKEDVNEWANLIELRDDIGFDGETENKVKELIFELANPEITHELSVERATELIDQLCGIII